MSNRIAAVRRELTAVAIAVGVTLAIGSTLMMVAGASPGHVWFEMASRIASSRYAIGDVLFKATAIALTGMAVSLALDAGLFNLGVEGQLTAGVVACAVVGSALPMQTPAVVAIPLCALASALAGAFIGALIGVLRVTRDAHEVITSFMFNAIVVGFALWLGNAVLFQNGTTTGPAIVPGAELPQLSLGGSSVNAALAAACAAAVGLWYLRSRTTWGWAVRTVGRNPETARAVGISLARVQIGVMAVSGALAGLAATNFVLGRAHAFQDGLGRGAGLMGVSAALVGRLHPIGVVFAALGLGFLSAAGLVAGELVPKELSEMLQGVALLAIAIAVPFVRRARAAGAA